MGAECCDDRVCVCLSVREHISGTTRPIFANFCACYPWPWLGPLAGLRYVMYFRFMDDVVLAHEPRQLNVAAQLIEAQPTCSLRLGYAMNGPLRANVLTLTGLLFGRRGLGVLGCSGRVEFS